MPLDPITGSLIAGLGTSLLGSLLGGPSRSEKSALDAQSRVAAQEERILKIFEDVIRQLRGKTAMTEFGLSPEDQQEFFGREGGIIGKIGEGGGFIPGGLDDLLASGKLDFGALAEMDALKDIAGLARGVGTGTVGQAGAQAFGMGQERRALSSSTSAAIAQIVAGLLARKSGGSLGGGGAINLGGVMGALPPFTLRS